uniref:Zgc:112496 n=1 Tax=Haplochromis burtoni TaxID=8153 RepID=A0A3Q2WFA7_HAPBU
MSWLCFDCRMKGTQILISVCVIRYQQELPSLISSRPDKHVSLSELKKLMEWKLTRGKFRPRLQQLVASNSEDEVEKCSRKAFTLLPDVQAAIAELSCLKGVGPATASAVLAAGAPEQAAFMSDEAMESVPGLKPIHYTAKHYTVYLEKMTERTEKLNRVDPLQDWTPHRLELCLWAMSIATQLQLQLLKDIDVRGNAAGKKCSDSEADQRPTKKLKSA